MIILGIIFSALLAIVVIALIYSFAVGVWFGAPYLPTMSHQRQVALKLLNLKRGQTLYDLGCGDGRMLRLAAQQGLSAVGYELSPLLFLIAKITTWPYRRRVKVHLGDYWKADLSKADGIYIF